MIRVLKSSEGTIGRGRNIERQTNIVDFGQIKKQYQPYPLHERTFCGSLPVMRYAVCKYFGLKLALKLGEKRRIFVNWGSQTDIAVFGVYFSANQYFPDNSVTVVLEIFFLR